MKLSFKKDRLFFESGILLIIVLGLIIVALLLQKTISSKKPAHQDVYDKWYQRIKEIGGKQAYAEFKKETENKVTKKQHEEAHLFGEALYQTEGSSGITVCDTAFNSGCYHSFIGLAINNEGLKIIPILYEKCSQKPETDETSCPHGIGHGILSSIGYDFDSLKKTLEVCHGLKIKNLVSGCLDGTFMEYNFQTMLMDEGSRRRYDPNNPYFPCYDIDDKFSSFCMFQQSQWWLGTIKKDIPERVKEIDTLCYKLSNKEHQNVCYKGLGLNILGNTNYDVEGAKKICNSLSSREAELVCRAGVTINLKQSSPRLKNRIEEFCNDPSFTELEQKFCNSNTKQISFFN